MRCALTTVDNPYDPLKDFDDWYAYDESHGYCTSGYLARITMTSDDLSESDREQAVSDAIDEIIAMNGDGFYKKIVENE